MKKGYTSGVYWLISLGAAFALLNVLTSAFMDHETLVQLFHYNRHHEGPRDMAYSFVVLGLSPCTAVAGLFAAAAYNYRCGRVLRSMGESRFGNEHVLACLLCATAGGAAAAFYLLMLSSLGFAMLIIGGCFALTVTPLLAVFCGLKRLDANAAAALRGAALRYPRPNPQRVHTLSGAFRQIFDWNSRPLRLAASVVYFTSLAMLMNVLLEGPLTSLLQDAADQAAAAGNSFQEGLIDMAALAAPYLPMVSGLLCAIYADTLILSSRRCLHPAALLLGAGPAMAVVSHLMLLVLTIAGVYSVVALLFAGFGIAVIAANSKIAAVILIARMAAHRHIRYEESLTLKLILLVTFLIPLLFVVAGG